VVSCFRFVFRIQISEHLNVLVNIKEIIAFLQSEFVSQFIHFWTNSEIIQFCCILLRSGTYVRQVAVERYSGVGVLTTATFAGKKLLQLLAVTCYNVYV